MAAAFDIVYENGRDQAFAMLGTTLWSVNLKNGDFTKPFKIKGLTGDVLSIAFVTPKTK